MAGEAKTNAFLLSSATVMIGAMDKVFELDPATHSLGLVKNFQVSAEPAYTELTQGVRNQIVYSVLTGNPVRAQMEVYEFGAKNLSYGLGLDGSSLTAKTPLTLKTAITNGGTAVVANAASDPGYSTGDLVMIQYNDKVHVGKLASAGTFSTDQVTLTLTAGTAMPTGMTFPVGCLVSKANVVSVGKQTAQPFFSDKVVGILPQDNTPICILFPKLRITRGFTLNFSTDNFGNLPFEFTPYEMVAADALYSDFSADVYAKLLTIF